MLAREDIKTTIGKMGATGDWGTPQQFSRFRAGRDDEIRRGIIKGRRPADGRELRGRFVGWVSAA